MDKEASPRLSRHFNMSTLWNLPAWSEAPQTQTDQLAALKRSGVEAVQHPFAQMLGDIELPLVGMSRIDEPGRADQIAKTHKSSGYLLTTLHVGTGLEGDAVVDSLLGAVIEASIRHDYPLFIETHRATVTQDIRRTLDIVDRFPDVRFNGDLSHWYTGHELTYGDIDAKLDIMAPVFERVRYMHGRIGTPCCVQVPIKVDDDRTFVGHFRDMWTRCMLGFKQSAVQGEILPFAPELLPYSLPLGESEHLFYYARLLGNNTEQKEESDRWVQSQLLWDLAAGCAEQAGLVVEADLMP